MFFSNVWLIFGFFEKAINISDDSFVWCILSNKEILLFIYSFSHQNKKKKITFKPEYLLLQLGSVRPSVVVAAKPQDARPYVHVLEPVDLKIIHSVKWLIFSGKMINIIDLPGSAFAFGSDILRHNSIFLLRFGLTCFAFYYSLNNN